MRGSSRAGAVAAGALIAIAGCGKQPHKHHHRHDAAVAGGDPWAQPPKEACERLPFAESIPLAEASGAAWLAGDGDGTVIVVGDSGRHGAYVEIGAADGQLIRRGSLPLGGGAGDDLEGLATDGERLWALTSAGQMRAWVRDGDGFRLVLGPYAIEEGSPCGPASVNCGHDFEGLCLRSAAQANAPGGCAGYAAAKADGAIYCLVRQPAAGGGTRLVTSQVHSKGSHEARTVTTKGALADCAIAADGAVWTGDNAFGGGVVRRLDARAWEGALGDGFPEAMALAPGGIVYRFSDTSGEPSLAGRFRCEAAPAGGPASSTIGPP